MQGNRPDLHARLTEVIDELERRFGPGVVYRLSQARPKLGATTVSTGSLGIDLATGIGGMPRGHIASIDGPETSGKTTLAYHVLARAQADGGLAALVAAAQSADPAHLRACGVDLRSLLLAEPLDAVEALAMAAILTHSAALDAVVVSRPPRLPRPGLLAEAARRLNASIGGTPTALVMVGPIDFASLSIQLTPLRLILRPGGDVGGLRGRATVGKNRLARPGGMAEVDVLEGVGVHRPAELFDLGRSLGLIEELPLGFICGAALLGKGRVRAVAGLERDPDLARRLEAAIRQAAAAAPAPAPPRLLHEPALTC